MLSIYAAKIKVLINSAVTAQLICAFMSKTGYLMTGLICYGCCYLTVIISFITISFINLYIKMCITT